MSNFVHSRGNFLIIDIVKPIFETDDYSRVRVNKKYFDKARTSSMYVLIRTERGEHIFLPKAMKKTKVVKEVFLYPDRPMEMYDLDIPHCDKKDEEYYVYA